MLKIITVIAIAFVTTVAVAQDPALQGEAYKTIPLPEINSRTNIYPPVGKDERLGYYSPFFAFEADEHGELVIGQTRNPRRPDETILRLSLLVSPTSLLEDVSRQIREAEELDPRGRYGGIQASDLIAIPLAGLTVKESHDVYGFQTASVPYLSTLGRIDLVCRVPTDLADQYVEDLQNGGTSFMVEYELNALKFTRSTAKMRRVYFYDTNAVKELRGAGSPLRIANQGTDSLSVEATAVTRKQRDTFRGRLVSELEADVIISSDADRQFLEGIVLTYVTRAFEAESIDPFKEGGCVTLLSRLAQYDFAGGDIKPDQFQKLANDIQKFFSSKDQTHFHFDAKAEASFCGLFGAEASMSLTRDELRERMEKAGWNFKTEGRFTVPKSLDIYVLQETVLSTEGVVQVNLTTARNQAARFSEPVMTTTRFFPGGPASDPEYLVAVRRMERDIAEHGKWSTAISDRLAKIEQDLKFKILDSGSITFNVQNTQQPPPITVSTPLPPNARILVCSHGHNPIYPAVAERLNGGSFRVTINDIANNSHTVRVQVDWFVVVPNN